MRGSPVRFADFRGGLNTRDALYLQDPTQARDLLNVTSTRQGSIRRRDGALTYATPAAELLSLAPCEATASKFLIGATGSNLYSIAVGGTVSSIKGAMAVTSSRWEFVNAPASGGQGPLWGMNGVDQPIYWIGAGNAAAWTASTGAVPNGKFIRYLANRVLVAGTFTNPSRVYASAPGDARNWGTAAGQGWVIDLDPDDGDAITGLGSIGPYLLVFKRDKVFVIWNLENGANRRLAVGTGCISHRSIAETPHGTLFLTPDKGVWRTDGQRLERVSELVTPTVAAILAAQAPNACGAFWNDHYLLSFCDSGATPTKTLDLDLQLNSWWLHSLAANQLAVWHPAGAAECYAAKAGQTVVDRWFAPNAVQDNGQAFTATWKGPWLAQQAPYMHKRVRQVHVDGSGSVDMTLGRDFAVVDELAKTDLFVTTTGTWGVDGTFGGAGVFGGGALLQEARRFTPGVGRAWSVGFTKTASQSFEIESYTVMFQGRKN